MTPRDLINFKQALKTIASSLENKEKFLIAPLAIRLTRAATENPGDQTIISVASYLQKRAQKDSFISRSELDDVYSKFYTTNNRCAEYLPNELSKKAELPEPAPMIRHEQEGSLMDGINSKLDQGLVNSLHSVFDKDAPFKSWSNETEEAAKTACLREIGTYDFQPVLVKVVAGSEDALLCQATYETPKGKSNVIVPVELSGGKALLPTLFVNDKGFHNLSEESLGLHIASDAGKKYRVNADAILEIVRTAKHGVEEPQNEVERIVALASVNKETPASHDANSIFAEIDSVSSILETKPTEESELFASRLGSTKGIAEFTHGKAAVDAGRNLLLKSLAGFGYKAQVSVVDVDNDHVVYAASLGTSGIKVPVKFEKGLPVYPSIALAGGEVGTFDSTGVADLFSKSDASVAASGSEFVGNRPSDLIDSVKSAMNSGNLEKAEDALNVLANSGDHGSFKYAFELYHSSLKDGTQPVVKTASDGHKCSMQIKTANSQHVLCGHLNLPLHKVCQNDNGECLPLYRKNLEHSDTDVRFITSKVYFE